MVRVTQISVVLIHEASNDRLKNKESKSIVRKRDRDSTTLADIKVACAIHGLQKPKHSSNVVAVHHRAVHLKIPPDFPPAVAPEHPNVCVPCHHCFHENVM